MADSRAILTVIPILRAEIRRLASCGTVWLANCCAPRLPVGGIVKEDNLVEMAIRRILLNLALLAWLLSAQAVAQQQGSVQDQGLARPSAPARQLATYQQPLPTPAGQPEAQPLEPQPDPAPITQPDEQGPLDPGDPFAEALQEEESSVGQCCANCGGGAYCPPDWYVDQGVRIWHRCRPHRDLLASGFTSTFFISEISGQNMWRVSGFEANRNLMTTKSFGFDVAPAYNITLGHYLGRDTKNRDHFVEVAFFGMTEWQVHANVRGDVQPIYQGETWTQAEYDQYLAGTRIPIISEFVGSLLSSFPLVTFNGVGYVFPDNAAATPRDAVISRAFNQVDSMEVAYRSAFNNYELNARIKERGRNDKLVLHPNGRWRRECQQGWFMSYLFGMRVLTLDEGFGLYTDGARYAAEPWIGPSGPVYVPSAAPTYEKSGSLIVLSHNRLVGMQVGGDLMYRRCLWEWGMRYKVGAMMNFSDQTTRLVARQTDPGLPSMVSVTRRATKDGAAGLAEVGVVGSYKITPNVTFHAAWDWMWVTGLALAPEQISYNSGGTSRVNDNGYLFFQGLSLNLECNW